MSAKSEYDAAYFTLLRAIEERDALLRYREFLHEDRDRLDAFTTETNAWAEPLAPKVRRPVDRTAKGMLEAVGRRRAVVLDELGRIEHRIANAEQFVLECEREVAGLRGHP